MSMERPNINKYFLDLCTVVASRSTCPRASVGAILVKNKHILATGYNGSPMGADHCSDVGCEVEGEHCIRTVHAEANAIAQAALHGVSVKGATMYCTHAPCYTCAKLMINSGIVRVIALKDYHASKRSKDLFQLLSLALGTNITIYEYKSP